LVLTVASVLPFAPDQPDRRSDRELAELREQREPGPVQLHRDCARPAVASVTVAVPTTTVFVRAATPTIFLPVSKAVHGR